MPKHMHGDSRADHTGLGTHLCAGPQLDGPCLEPIQLPYMPTAVDVADEVEGIPLLIWVLGLLWDNGLGRAEAVVRSPDALAVADGFPCRHTCRGVAGRSEADRFPGQQQQGHAHLMQAGPPATYRGLSLSSRMAVQGPWNETGRAELWHSSGQQNGGPAAAPDTPSSTQQA